MTAYGLAERFADPGPCYRIFDPGAYQPKHRTIKQNKCAFLSKTPRKSLFATQIYTHAIYFADKQTRIPNVTSIISKTPRFRYDESSIQGWEALFCRCQMECECPSEEEPKVEPVCQANVRKRLFKGCTPHSNLIAGLSCPSRRDRGFEMYPDGSVKRLFDEEVVEDSPFYDTRVNEATAVYHGCKWSKWTEKRDKKSGEISPGPADYTICREQSQFEKCIEKIRAHRRKHNKQLRYVEELQDRLMRDGFPGPSDYSPQLPKGTDMQCLGTKAIRFEKHEDLPGPADYTIRRFLDQPPPAPTPCHAFVLAPIAFNVTAKRFNYINDTGPGPADYNANVKLCQSRRCVRAPFLTTALRFKENIEKVIENEEDIDYIEDKKTCLKRSWQFKSETQRFKTQECVDCTYMSLPKPEQRSLKLQYIAPFSTSQGRFQPWNGWLPSTSGVDPPAAVNNNVRKLKCSPAYNRGPTYRSSRFSNKPSQIPAPNQYKVEDEYYSLATHNVRLKQNTIKKQSKFVFKRPKEQRELTPLEKELALIEKAVKQLEVKEITEEDKKESKKEVVEKSVEKIVCICNKPGEVVRSEAEQSSGVCEIFEPEMDKVEPECIKRARKKIKDQKPKLLQTFLYSHQLPQYS